MFIFGILSFLIVSFTLLQDSAVSADVTILPHSPFNPDEDAISIYRAMKGYGTDEEKIIYVATKRTHAQRLQITENYQKRYDKSIFEDFRGNLGGNFLKMMTAMFQPIPLFFAIAIRNAVKRYGTDEAVLNGIFCCLPEGIIDEIIYAYKEEFKGDLIKDVSDVTAGHYKWFLQALMKGNRDSSKSYHCNETHSSLIVKSLVKSGAGKDSGTTAKELIKIFSETSYMELTEVANLYEKNLNFSLESSLESGTSGCFGDLLVQILLYAQSPVSYHVDLLKAILHRNYFNVVGYMYGRTPETLIQILVTRSEHDLNEIIREYNKNNLEFLEDDLKSVLSGDFVKACLSVIKSNE